MLSRILLLVLAPALVLAQEAPPYRELEGRREGVLERPEIEPGRKIALFGLRLAAEEGPPGDPAEPWRLAFWLPDSGAAHVLVREYASRYKMEMRRDLPAGAARLEWPSEIARDCGLGRDDLLPLVVSEGGNERQVCPAVVFRERPAIGAPRYVFSLVSRVPVTLLDWEVRARGSSQSLAAGTLRGVAADRPFDIEWTPEAPAGIFDFLFHVTLQPQPGTPARKTTVKYGFLHDPDAIAALFPAEEPAPE